MKLTEIARLAKVSPATVSRVLNHPEIVSPPLRRRVEAVLRRIEHRPEPRVRRRRPGRTRRIGVWFIGARRSPSFNWFQDQFLQLQEREPGPAVELELLFGEHSERVVHLLERGEIAGVILQGMEPSAAALAALAPHPHVWFMTRRSATWPGDYVEPDNAANGRAAADYLHRCGDAVVASVTTHADYSAVRARRDAFEARCRELGLRVERIEGTAPDDESYLHHPPPTAEVEAMANRFAALSPRPTGVYLPIDIFCGAFYRALRTRGIIPARDAHIVLGHLRPVVYTNLDPLPAALDINLPTLVQLVIRQLRWRIEHPRAPGRIGLQVAPTLVLPPDARRPG